MRGISNIFLSFNCVFKPFKKGCKNRMSITCSDAVNVALNGEGWIVFDWIFERNCRGFDGY